MNTDWKEWFIHVHLCSSVAQKCFVGLFQQPRKHALPKARIALLGHALACPLARGSVVGIGRDHAKAMDIDLVRRGNRGGRRTRRGDTALAQRRARVGGGDGGGGLQRRRQAAQQFHGSPLPIDLRVSAAQGQGQRDGGGGGAGRRAFAIGDRQRGLGNRRPSEPQRDRGVRAEVPAGEIRRTSRR